MIQLPNEYIIAAEEWWKKLTEDQKKHNLFQCGGKFPSHAIVMQAIIAYNNDQDDGNEYYHLLNEHLGILNLRWTGKFWDGVWVFPDDIVWSNYI